MRDDETTITYTVEMTGDQYDHERLRERIAEINGARITAEREPEETA